MKRFYCTMLALGLIAAPVFAQVTITNGPEKVSISIDGKPYSDFYVAGAELTKPYLWPILAPSGTYVTRMWPMEKVEEEASIAKPDHKHQRGIWFVTIRRRGAAILRRLERLPAGAWQKAVIDTPKRCHTHIRYVDERVRLRGYQGEARQLAVGGLGREEPTLFLSFSVDAAGRLADEIVARL